MSHRLVSERASERETEKLHEEWQGVRGGRGEVKYSQNVYVYIVWLIAVVVEERVRHFYHSIECMMRLLMSNSVSVSIRGS